MAFRGGTVDVGSGWNRVGRPLALRVIDDFKHPIRGLFGVRIKDSFDLFTCSGVCLVLDGHAKFVSP